jgi:hypothetical protein
MVSKTARKAVLILWLLCIVSQSFAGTVLDFWHAYQHQPSGVTHFSFHIANYKRGLFFGSCGPSTRSLQWAYEVDLAGPGPAYGTNDIRISTDGRPLTVVAGTITISGKQDSAAIQIQTKQSGTNSPGPALSFAGNGTHPIRKLK